MHPPKDGLKMGIIAAIKPRDDEYGKFGKL